MSRYSLIVLLMMGTVANASPILTMGAGVESRIAQEVNPENTSMTGFGQLYLSLSKRPWSALWEIGRASTEDRTGNYSIKDVQYTTMIWGRYEPWSYMKVSPYFGAGLGWQFDDITTQFGAARDTRWGDGGGIIGLATGAMTTLYDHWNIEGELRVAKFEMSLGPTWSVLLRSGYTF